MSAKTVITKPNKRIFDRSLIWALAGIALGLLLATTSGISVRSPAWLQIVPFFAAAVAGLSQTGTA